MVIWIHNNKINELKELNRYSGYSTSHFWINLEPETDDKKDGLKHLSLTWVLD